MTSQYELELHYTPWATTSPALRTRTRSIIQDAGIPVARETAAYGTDGPLPQGMRWATPPRVALHFYVGEGADGPDGVERHFFVSVQSQLKAAVGALRRAFPETELGIGLATFTTHRRTLYAFKHDDTPEDLEAAIDALVDRCDHDQSRVHGWDRTAKEWLPL
jgi:hypothetical protein